MQRHSIDIQAALVLLAADGAACLCSRIFIVVTGSSRDIQNFQVDNVMIAVVRRRSHVLVTSSDVIIASIH